MRYITNSETAVMRRCPRKWYLSHYRRLIARAERINESRLIGNLVHAALEYWYSSGQDPVATIIYESEQMLQAQEELLQTAGESATQIIEHNISTIEASRDFSKIIIEGYMQWLEEEGPDQHLTLIKAETELAVELPIENLPKPVSLLAKLDARFLDERTGANVFMDHKTVDRFSDRERWAHLDPQFLFYGLVEYLVSTTVVRPGEEAVWTDGGILNMLRKVKRTSRSTPPFYKRKEVRHTLIELTNFFTRLTGEVTRILQTETMLDSGVDHRLACPPNPTRDCSWDCPFMTLCGFMDDGSDSEGYVDATYVVGNPIARYESVTALEVV